MHSTLAHHANTAISVEEIRTTIRANASSHRKGGVANEETAVTWMLGTSMRSERVRWDSGVSNLFLQTHEVKEKENGYSNGAERSVL
jgi:hypothetical protein